MSVRDENFYADRQAERDARAAENTARRAERQARDDQARADRAASQAARLEQQQQRDARQAAERAARVERQDALRAERAEEREEARDRAQDRRDQRQGGIQSLPHNLLHDPRRAQRTLRDYGTLFGTGEALIGGHINGLERHRWEARDYRAGTRANNAELPYRLSDDQLEAYYAKNNGQPQWGSAVGSNAQSYGSYGPAYNAAPPAPTWGSAPGAGASTPTAYGAASSAAAWGSAPQQYASVTPAPPRGYGSGQGAATQQAWQSHPSKAPIESITRPLERAMNSTGEARLTAMREAVQAVERIGPDAPLQTLPGIGITYQAGGRKLPMPLPTTVTPTEIVRSTLKLYPDLEPALEAVYNERAGKAGPAAPAPSATPAAPAPIPAAPNGATPGPVPSAPAAASTANAPATSTTPAVAALAEIPKATGKAAAYHGHKKNELRISLAQNQVDEVQQLLIANKLPVGSRDGKPDGKNGDVTQGSLKMLAQEFGIDPRKINFAAAERSPETQQFLEKAQQRAASLAAPATKGPSAEELAAQERARAEAASREQTARETQARAEADRREAPALLGTAYDSRNLARMSEEQRGQLARQTLLAIDELANKNKAHDYENLHDKMKEAVREANDIVGDNRFQLPLDQNHPFTTDAMTALGIVAAHKGHLDRPVRNEKEAREVVEDLIDMLDIKGRSQADRIATIERSAGLPVDGKVDPAMLRAAQQFFAQQAQLAPIRGGAEVTGSDVAAASVRGERGAAERAPGA